MFSPGPHAVDLVGVRGGEGQHPAHVLHAGHLRAERSLGVEVAVDKVAELLGPDLALAVDADAARPRDQLAGHVPRRARHRRGPGAQTEVGAGAGQRGHVAHCG